MSQTAFIDFVADEQMRNGEEETHFKCKNEPKKKTTQNTTFNSLLQKHRCVNRTCIVALISDAYYNISIECNNLTRLEYILYTLGCLFLPAFLIFSVFLQLRLISIGFCCLCHIKFCSIQFMTTPTNYKKKKRIKKIRKKKKKSIDIIHKSEFVQMTGTEVHVQCTHLLHFHFHNISSFVNPRKRLQYHFGAIVNMCVFVLAMCIHLILFV